MNLIFKASLFYQFDLIYTIFSKPKYNSFQLSSFTHLIIENTIYKKSTFFGWGKTEEGPEKDNKRELFFN